MHLTGGILNDSEWQKRWLHVTSLPLSQYRFPNGAVGRKFITIFTKELAGINNRQWNAEKGFVFITVILQ